MSRRDRKQRKKRQRQERVRKERHERRSAPSGEWVAGPLGPEAFEPFEIPSEISVERELRETQEGGSFLDWLLPWRPRRSAEEEKRRRAQRLAYDALDEPEPGKATKLAREALALDPDCADAYHALADTPQPPAERLALLEKAVAAGERSLGGEAYFREHSGRFWLILQTRPYMRAREALAWQLHEAGRLAEAVGHLEAMMGLNPNDNQGVRDTLLGWYVEAGNLDGVRRLLEACEGHGDRRAVVCWTRVLERFLSGDRPGARQALSKAEENNPHVRDYLTGKRRLPHELPAYHGLGDVTEAMVCAAELEDMWRRHPQALHWLKQQHGP